MDFHLDAVIFDMDGTLLDTMRYWRFTTLEYLLAHQKPVRTEDLIRMQDTSSRRFLFEIAQREGFEIGAKEEVVAELEGFMHRHYLCDAKLKPHVKELLSMLKDQQIRMCVATGAPRAYARAGLSRVGILDYFEFVTDNYEFGITKDKPEYFLHVTKKLNAVPERCLVIEDALYAMQAAKSAGCTVYAIAEETARKQRQAIRALADRFMEDYSELL